MEKHANCQSCGMPLKRDPKGGGSNADGSRNHSYCSHCYVAGRFTQPEITMEEMRARVIDKLSEMGFPQFIARFFARNIHKLERWQQTNH